jgi:hypothetical protein
MECLLRVALDIALLLIWLPVSSLGEEMLASTMQEVAHESTEIGDARAQYELGLAYEFGFGKLRDISEALRWYRKAAEQGYTAARSALGRMYFEGKGVKQDFAESARWYGCSKPAESILRGCKETSYADLPQSALDLLTEMKCSVSHNYDFGSALDLNGDGSLEYQICCNDARHGPCNAVVIGKIGSEWKYLSAGASLGFTIPCALFIVLASESEGFHDICQPTICSPLDTKTCVPTMWKFKNGRYRIVETKSSAGSR